MVFYEVSDFLHQDIGLIPIGLAHQRERCKYLFIEIHEDAF